jgi:hypothetical protein
VNSCFFKLNFNFSRNFGSQFCFSLSSDFRFHSTWFFFRGAKNPPCAWLESDGPSCISLRMGL